MPIAAHPGLYDPDDDRPVLLGVRCDACGAVSFPPFGIGCQVCGARADALVAEPLEASGVLHSVATVHLHGGSDVTAPFTMAEIQLDGGPLIRATLTEVADPSAIGRRVAGRWVTTGTNDDGDEIVEPRFDVVDV